MIAEQYERAKRLLLEKKEGHAQLAQLLVEREVIYAEDVEEIFGKRPWASRTEELLEANDTTPRQDDEPQPAMDEQAESNGEQ